MLEQHLGASLAADTAASGVNYDWMQEFADQATGLGATFRPTIIGFGAVLDNLSAFLDNLRRPVVIAGAASGVHRPADFRRRRHHRSVRARPRDPRARLLRGVRRVLLQVSAAGGRAVGSSTRCCSDSCTRGCSTRLFPRITRDVTVERTAFLVRVGAVRRLRPPARRMQRRLRLREGARGRRGSPQHARRDPRGGGLHRAQLAAPRRCSISPTSCCSRWWSAIYAARRARRGWNSARRCGSGSPSVRLYVLARLWVKLVFWASETALFQAASPTPGTSPRRCRVARVAGRRGHRPPLRSAGLSTIRIHAALCLQFSGRSAGYVLRARNRVREQRRFSRGVDATRAAGSRRPSSSAGGPAAGRTESRCTLFLCVSKLWLLPSIARRQRSRRPVCRGRQRDNSKDMGTHRGEPHGRNVGTQSATTASAGVSPHQPGR